MEGKVVRSDDPRIDRLIPAHINCACMWVEIGDREGGKQDWLDWDDEEFQELLDTHAHFHANKKYEALRVPASPSGRDFVFRRGKAGERGTREWKRPRYEERDDLVEAGVEEKGEKWRPVGRPLPRSPGEGGDEGSGGSAAVPPAPRHHETVEAAEQWFAERGIATSFGDNLDLANAATEAWVRVERPGRHLPSALRYEERFFQEHERYRDDPVVYDETTGTLYVNASHRMWANWEAMVAESRRQARLGHWSSPDPLGSLLHEVGHAAHLAADEEGPFALTPERLSVLRRLGQNEAGTQTFNERERWTPDTVEWAGRVSDYAIQGPLEFVAEEFAARSSQPPVTFDDEVMALYHWFGGP